MEVSAAFCAEHATAAAVATCARCGSFVCERCANPGVDEQTLCVACVERSGFASTPRATTALVLATITFVGALPGIVALVLANAELRDISEGTLLPDGAMFAKLARSIAWMELGALLVGAMIYVAHRVG